MHHDNPASGCRNQRLRVTLVTPEWPGARHSGGVARYAYRLAERLRSQVDLTVITEDGNDVDLQGVTVLRAKRARGRLGRYYVLPIRLRRLVVDSRPDVVHSFGDDWALQRRWPFVRTFHGSALEEARSSRGLRRLNHYLLAVLEHRSARRSNVRVAVGADSLAEFRCDVVMPPIVPVERMLVRSELPSVVFVGSFNGRKRGWMVAEMVNHLRSVSRTNLRLVVVGPAQDESSWPSYVEHHSDLEDAEVLELISEAWVLAAPSSYEGFGIPAFEALALGTPVVTSPTPGSEYILEHLNGRSGFDVAADDSFKEALAARLLGAPPERSSIPSSQVDSLLRVASTENLVNFIYPLAAKRFEGPESKYRR